MFDLINSRVNPGGEMEWRQNWPVVASAMAGLAAAHSHLYSMGVMIAPLESEFGWSRAKITSGLFIISMILFPLSPVLGAAIDRFGPRRIALSGILIYCLAVASLSLTQQSIWSWWLLWVFVGLGALFLTPTVWVTAITSLYSSSRGLALACLLSATGFMSFSGPLVTYFLVDNFGWRMAYVLWGAISATISIPLLFFFFSSAKDKRRTGAAVADHYDIVAQNGVSFREAVGSISFVKLAIAGPVMAVVFTAFIVNIVPILSYSGIGTATAAAIAGVTGIAQIIGRLSSGYLIDRFDARHVGAIVVLFPVIAVGLLILFGGSAFFALVAVFFFGLAAGSELDVLAYLSSRIFGARNFGAIFGAIMGMAALGGGIGPILGNMVYDHSNSYAALLWAIIPLCLLSSYSFFSLGAYPEFDGDEAADFSAS